MYLNSGVYTYVFDVTPSIDNISEVNTGVFIGGFNSTAGYSYNDAALVGTGFTIGLDTDGTLDYATITSGAFDSSETVSFFFQSTLAPTSGPYNMINLEVGTATGFVPVPESGTMLMLIHSILGLGLIGWKFGVNRA